MWAMSPLSMLRGRCWARLLAIALTCLLTACAGLPTVERTTSYSFADTEQTKLGQALGPQVSLHPNESGFYPLLHGLDAFTARIALARVAQRSLDLQYYVYHKDKTGMVLLGELLAAAERGVRVRLLLDDIHTEGKDQSLAIIASHPNIEVRLFNPFVNRNARWLDFAGDFRRINRRMHNKSMTADNQVTIVGGRNIGDEYFSAKSDVDFSDFDLFAIGPVVKEVSKEFDAYWNSELAYPVGAFAASKPTEEDFHALRERIAKEVDALRTTPYVLAMEETDLAEELGRGPPHSYWGKAQVIADPPEKMSLPPEKNHSLAISKLARVLEQAQKEMVLVSPYFVPGPQGARWLEGMVKRGVHVTVVTNSFEATDVPAVHAGYTTYRKRLLEAGVTLYEMKPAVYRDRSLQGKQRGLTGSSRSSLHAKTYMMDQRVLFVGSLNLDGRSAALNTEMGVVVESEALCKALHDNSGRDLRAVSYRVQLERDPQSGQEHLVWITQEEGQDVRYESEPGMGAFQHLMQGVLKLLPIEDQL